MEITVEMLELLLYNRNPYSEFSVSSDNFLIYVNHYSFMSSHKPSNKSLKHIQIRFEEMD